MKKSLFAIIFIGCVSIVAAQETPATVDLKFMKKQKEVLSLNTDLMSKKIDLEKELHANEKIKSTVENLNGKSDRKTNSYGSSDPESTVKDAKSTAKVLKKTEVANKDLDHSNNRIIHINADIKKLETKLQRLKYVVEIKQKQS